MTPEERTAIRLRLEDSFVHGMYPAARDDVGVLVVALEEAETRTARLADALRDAVSWIDACKDGCDCIPCGITRRGRAVLGESQ